MRIKAAAVMILVAFAITAAIFPASQILSNNSLAATMEKDLFSNRGIADGYVSLTDLRNALLISLAVGLLAALSFSGLAARPFDKMREQNTNLEKINETIMGQTAHIRDEYDRATLLLNAMPFACHLWDKNFQLFDCNDKAMELVGISNKLDLIDNFLDFSPQYQPDGRPSRYAGGQCIKKAFADGKYVFEWMHRAVDGTPIPTEITLVRVIYRNEYFVAGYMRDLREQKRINGGVERRDNLLNAGNQAAAVMAPVKEEVPEIAKNALDSLGLSNAEYNVPSLIKDAIIKSIPHLVEKPVRFVLSIDENLPVYLCGDELRIKQILYSLLANAFKHTAEGTVELSVSCVRKDNATWLLASVRDTGLGIQPENIGELFSFNTQMGAKPNGKFAETGLKLPIAQKLAELMNGMIVVESEYSKGSVFTMRLLQQSVDEATVGPEAAENLKADIREWIRDKEQEKEPEATQQNAQKEIYEAIFDEIYKRIQKEIKSEVLKEAPFEMQKQSSGHKLPEHQEEHSKRLYSDRKSGGSRRKLSYGLSGLGGLDINSGIKRFAGDEEAYFDVLRSYTKNTPALLDAAKAVSKDGMTDYAAVIHAIKDSSRGICANEFADIAETMEKAAKAGDYGYVRAHNAAFLDAAWKLVLGVDEMLAQINAANPKPRMERPDQEALDRMLAACRDYDIDAVYDALADLEGFEYESGGGLVAWLSENVLQMNFTEIIDMLSALDE